MGANANCQPQCTSSKSKRSHNRRATKRRIKKETEGRQVREHVGQSYVKTEAMLHSDVHYVDLPVSSCGFHGKIEAKAMNGVVGEQTVATLKAEGCVEIAWDGM